MEPAVKDKLGSKRTKLGLIPQDWDIFRIREIAKVKSGGTPDRSHEEYWNGAIPWVTTTDVNFEPINSTREFITEDGLANSSAKIFPKGTILMAMYGQGKTRGQSSILEIDAATNQACAALIIKKGNSVEFIAQQLRMEYGRIRSYSNTGNQENLNAAIIKSIELRLPPLPEQRKIAEILGTWDTAIDQTRKLIAQLKLRNKGLAQQLLTGKRRLPGFEGEWREVKLGEIFKRVRRKNDGSDLPVMTISAGQGFLDQSERFNRVIAGRSLTNYLIVQKGEFAYNKGNSKTYPQGCIYEMRQNEAALVPHVYYCFRPTAKLSNNFFRNYFMEGLMNPQLAKMINSGVRNDGLLNLNVDDFFACKVKFPSFNEQVAIAERIDASRDEIRIVKGKLELLQEQKKGLMQQLLTGQRRVKV